MSDEVKFIFKTLLKVPIFIMVTYIIFNLFSFSVSYFKLLSLSYVANQVAVENNFIPAKEQELLNKCANGLETKVLHHVSVVGWNSVTGTNTRQQYGANVNTMVSGKYRVIFPLMPVEYQGKSTGVSVMQGKPDQATTVTGNPTDERFDEIDDDNNDRWNIPIVIKNETPGLKYYPDLA